MEILDAIRTRRSIRAYLPLEVSQEIIREIMEVSMRTPSAINTQPWEITVVSGEVLESIRRENIENILSGAPTKEPLKYEGLYKQRQIELAIDLFNLMNIKREDREKRKEWSLRGYRFFDAPVAIILSIDKSLRYGTMASYDIGALGLNICLTAMNYGLGTCIEEQGVVFPEVIRKYTGIPDNKDIIIGIALGYPDPTFPANQIVSRRVPVEEVTSWCGF